MKEEEIDSQWEKARDDAHRMVGDATCVLWPPVTLAPDAAAFVEDLASKCEGSFPFRRSVLYTVVHGRVHRITVEDIEPERRPKVTLRGFTAPRCP